MEQSTVAVKCPMYNYEVFQKFWAAYASPPHNFASKKWYRQNRTSRTSWLGLEVKVIYKEHKNKMLVVRVLTWQFLSSNTPPSYLTCMQVTQR